MTEPGIDDLTVNATDGFPLSMRLYRPATPRMAVMVSSGTGFPKRFYDRIARSGRARGRGPDL